LDETEVLTRLSLALGVGFLIGIERGWRERDQGEGGSTAGLRTFTLVGLSGGIWGLLATPLGPAPLAAAFVVIAVALTAFRWRETQKEGTFGATTLIAAFLTFALGAYAVLGSKTTTAAAAVAVAILLAAKNWLGGWLRSLTWPELRAALTLLAMSFIALPVLPDRAMGPYDALNPHSIWIMTIAIAGVSFMGYVAVRLIGQRYGTLVAGVAGGVVSSTATTLDMSRRARAAPARSGNLLAGALAASAMMFLRIGFIVFVFGPVLLPALIGPLAAAFLVTVAAALFLDPPWRPAPAAKDEKDAAFSNPLDLPAVLLFGAMIAVILVLTKVFTMNFGGAGAVVLAAIAGLADVDSVTLSMTQLAPTVTRDAVLAIMVAAAVNSLSKSVLAVTVGGWRFGRIYLATSLGALAAGAVAAFAFRSAFAG
jgi:uncharacterized membrane protein (DUF4010 family)